MANPFSGFLTPPQQTSALAGAPNYVLALSERQRGYNQDQQRKLENEQQNTRANARLGMEQAYQTRKFSQEDQKQVEALLAEYQNAKDQGDPVRLSRAAQKLQRFGMTVGQGPAKPDLRAFTGEQSLPSVPKAQPTPETLQALTGSPAAPGQDLSQEDFESQLIAGSGQLPERMESTSGGTSAAGTTAEGRAALGRVLPQPPEETSDQTDPGTVSAGSVVADFDADGFEPIKMPSGNVRQADGFEPIKMPSGLARANAEQRAPAPPRLATQLLPTVISKDGKKLYESTEPSGRWAPMVTSVFEPFAQHENPEIGAAAKRAQQMAAKLIAVDGVSPKDAINIGMDYLKGEASRINQLERTRLGTKPRYAGGGGTGLLGKSQDIAESAQIYDDNARVQAQQLQQEDVQYESIEGAINSSDPALQRDAVNQLLKIRSGTAVTAAEDARISQINGLLAQVQDRLGRWSGGAMTPEMRSTIQQIVALKRQVSQAKIKRIYEHQARLYEAQNEGKVKDPNILKKRADVVRRGGSVATGEIPEEDLY